MSQMGVERLIGKLVTDEGFRARFYRDPAAASFSVGIPVSQDELEAVLRLPAEAIAFLGDRVDARISRLALDPEWRSI